MPGDSSGKDPMAEKRVAIIKKDVPDDVQAEIIDMCMAAKDLQDTRKHSSKIKEALDRKFGGEWNVIMGESFAGQCAVAPGAFFQAKIADTIILVFKSSAFVKEKNSKH